MVKKKGKPVKAANLYGVQLSNAAVTEDQNAGGSSDQKAGGASDQNPGGASDQNTSGASDQNAGGASASTSRDNRAVATFKEWPYEEVKNATKDFSLNSKIGDGRFGPVYKVEPLPGKFYAVKKLNVFGRPLEDMASNLGLLRHSNLVNLVAYSTEGADSSSIDQQKQQLLVYEFIPTAMSLDQHLHDRPPESKPLDWAARIRIALGIARGLQYLHNVAMPSVIFSDLKTSKVLLDDTFLPRLSGFGFAGLGDQRPEPTDGYYAPEYCEGGEPTIESDAYSFGVILLELITGRRPRDIVEEQEGNYKLYDWFYPMFVRNKVEEVVDPAVRGKTGSKKGFLKAVDMVVLCLHKDPTRRLPMRALVEAMKFVLARAGGGDWMTIGEGEDPQLAVEDAPELEGA